MWAIWAVFVVSAVLGAALGVWIDSLLGIAEISSTLAGFFGASFGVGLGILFGYDRVGR